MYGLPGSSATARCVHTPASSQLRPVDDVRGELDRVVGIAPDAMHAGVDLQVHAQAVARAAVGDGLGERVDAARAVYTTGVSR